MFMRFRFLLLLFLLLPLVYAVHVVDPLFMPYINGRVGYSKYNIVFNPGIYPIKGGMFYELNYGVIDLGESEVYLGFVSRDRFPLAMSSYFSGFYVHRCVDRCDVDDVVQALSRFNYGVGVGDVLEVIDRQTGADYLVFFLYTMRYNLSPSLIVVGPTVKIYDYRNEYVFVPNPPVYANSPPIRCSTLTGSDCHVTMSIKLYDALYDEGSITYYIPVTFKEWGPPYTVGVAPVGAYFTQYNYLPMDDLNRSALMDIFSRLTGFPYSCDSVTWLDNKGCSYRYDPEPVFYRETVRPTGALYVSGVDLSPGLYPVLDKNICPASDCRYLSDVKTYYVDDPHNPLFAVATVLMRYYYSSVSFEVELERPPQEENVQQVSEETGSAQEVGAVEEEQLPECFVDVSPITFSVRFIDPVPSRYYFQDDYPRAFQIYARFPERCVIGRPMEYTLVTLYPEQNEIELKNYPFPRIGLVVDRELNFTVPFEFYPYKSFSLVVTYGDYSAVTSHVYKGPCIDDLYWVDFDDANMYRCENVCTPEGCDTANEGVQAAYDLQNGRIIDGVKKAWHFDFWGALLYGAFGVAAAAMGNLPELKWFLHELGPLGLSGVLLVELGVFMGAYYVASRCLDEKQQEVWGILSMMAAPFFGGLGALALAGLGCAYNKLKG